MNENRKKIIIKILKEKIKDLQAIYLFGSQNSNIATKDSDIDIAFLSRNQLSKKEIWDISNEIANILSTDVDLIDIHKSDTIFRYQIISTAERIYGNGYEIDKFEMLAISLYYRFQDERREIVQEIKKRKTIFAEENSGARCNIK
jgi:predicted nucleotidyltransferase